MSARTVGAARARRAYAELDRRLASAETLINEIETLIEALREGGRLRVADIAARRAVTEAQTRHVSLAAARDTLSDFAISIGAPSLDEGESSEAAAARLVPTTQSPPSVIRARRSARRPSRQKS